MMREKRFQAAQAGKLDNPQRLRWLPPKDVVAALAVRTGDTIADVGAGTGYFSLPLSAAVGTIGRVYAVDAQIEMINLLRSKLDQAEFSNLELIHAEAAQTGLTASSCDLFFLANLWHEIDDRAAVLSEALRTLKKGGRTAILDWRPDVEPVAGPPLAHRIKPAHVVEELRLAGFEQLRSADIGRYSWLVQAGKAE